MAGELKAGDTVTLQATVRNIIAGDLVEVEIGDSNDKEGVYRPITRVHRSQLQGKPQDEE